MLPAAGDAQPWWKPLGVHARLPAPTSGALLASAPSESAGLSPLLRRDSSVLPLTSLWANGGLEGSVAWEQCQGQNPLCPLWNLENILGGIEPIRVLSIQ